MKKTLLVSTIATTAIASLLTFTNVANAAPEGEKAKYGQMTSADKSARMEKRMNRIAKKLGLTDAQKTQMQALKTNSKNEIKPLRDEMKSLRKEMRSLDPKALDYSAKLADVANRKAELSRQMTIIKGSQRQQMANILSAEQLATMNKMRDSRKGGKRGGKRHHRKHGKKH